MLKIAVCDDNPIFLQEMESLLPEVSQVDSARFYTSPGVLLQEIADGAFFPQVVLMDIQLEDSRTGLSWSEELHRMAPEIGIILVTGFNDRYAQHVLLHDISLIGYLTKPLDLELLSRYLDKALEKQSRKTYFSFVLRGQNYSVATDSILYLESRNHTVILHTYQEVYEFYDKLSALRTRLPDFFVQCHKSYLVNLNHISRLEPSSVVLASSATVPVSKACHGALQKAFFHHIGQDF